MEGHFTMNTKEANQVEIFERLKDKRLKQNQAARLLQLSTRQVRRKLKRYKKEGPAGLVHTSRGKQSNNRVDEAEIARALDLIDKRYPDFGPQLAWEKLSEFHNVQFSVERLRQAMSARGTWKPKRRKRSVPHPLRDRRPLEGELVQMDGSPHDWFEGRGGMGMCTLLVFIDDATGKLKHLEFVPSESTETYMGAMKRYLEKHGKPVSLYCDRHGVFRVNHSKGGSAATTDSLGETQFGRAMRQLGIGVIHALSPQAKGRVERVNSTLQDRLVKEMRLAGIDTMEGGSAFATAYVEVFNKRFGVVAREPGDAHRPLLAGEDLEMILSIREERILSKELTCQYDRQLYQVELKDNRTSYQYRKAKVTIVKDLTGQIRIEYNGKVLAYRIIKVQPKAEVVDTKRINVVVDQIKRDQERRQAEIKARQNPWERVSHETWKAYEAPIVGS